MTYSIVAVDVEKRDIGVGVASKFIASGSIVPWVKLNVGAVATQSWANVKFGPIILSLLENGFSPKRAVEAVLREDPRRELRQVGVVSASGEAYAFTGRECIEYAGHIIGDGFVALGNILAGPQVIEEMAKAFESTKGELVDKILAALQAGDRAGGDRRGRQSAAIIVVRPCGGYGGCDEGVDKYVDLRVDDHPDPVSELKRLFKIWEITVLTREDPNDLVNMEDVAEKLQRALAVLGYYKGAITGSLNPETVEALKTWMAINNFENKIRGDDKIWGTVYRFLMEQAGIKE